MFAHSELIRVFVNHYLSLAIMAASWFYTAFVLATCVRYSLHKPFRRISLIFFIIFLIGTLSNIFCYIFSLIINCIVQYKGPGLPAFVFVNRLNWGLYITTCQSFALFFEYLYQKQVRIRFYHIFHGLVNIGISSLFLHHAFFKYNHPYVNPATLELELKLINVIYLYLPLLFAQLYYQVFIKRHAPLMSRILINQMRYLRIFTIAYLLLEMLNNMGASSLFGSYVFSFYALSTLLGSSAMYFASKRLLGLRILNLRQDVESAEKFSFLVQFRDILEQLSYATALKELAHLTQTFFQTAFAIPLGRTRLYLRKMDQRKRYNYYDIAKVTTNVEHFIGKEENQTITHALKTSKIFIRDDIEFLRFTKVTRKQ